MRLSILAAIAAFTYSASADLVWSLEKSSAPSDDEADAYAKIETAMTLAVQRYNGLADPVKTIRVYYAPGVPTAEANFSGDLRFGSNRSYMNERTALHEISHTLGIGQTAAFDNKCNANDWATATPLLQSWDGPDARINCGGSHIWPYGLNYDSEFSEEAANRHVLLIQAMINDGLMG
ncbi:uncharacterized protein F5Z01DRAFT_628406 [Emericellopsis atlantica]|uniref:Ricin B lectin n=1 Tax=Emericellopsis atlantica TaxID=2614577 RepID=A0A9P7ZFL2_9HYPO|nr:uncharacterized protein F5Z01DRAFT_628406 [Emericellopsis atlantica]KAG9251036.1 hypothetical protein F5Z01DRAFT_628406 [Emericellopsis atlantica]